MFLDLGVQCRLEPPGCEDVTRDCQVSDDGVEGRLEFFKIMPVESAIRTPRHPPTYSI